MDFPFLLGITGATLILLAFVLNQLHKLKDTDFTYDFLNFLGAAFLVYYGIITKTWPFVALNVVWTLVSLRDLIIFSQKNAKKI